MITIRKRMLALATAAALDVPGRAVRLVELPSIQGHDSFLVDMDGLRPPVAEFFAADLPAAKPRRMSVVSSPGQG